MWSHSVPSVLVFLGLVLVLVLPHCLLHAIKCSTLKRKSQSFPDIRIMDGASGLSFFEQSHATNEPLNALIPPYCDESLRVVLYNVHQFEGLQAGDNVLDRVQADLQRLQASVIVFQDLPRIASPSRTALGEWLINHGFQYIHQSPRHESLMIASTIDSEPIENISGVALQLMAIRVRYTAFHFNLCSLWMTAPTAPGAPVPPSEAVHGRLFLQAVSHDAPLTITMEPRMPLTNVFTALMRPAPKYTSWAGHVSDSVGVLGGIEAQVCSAYVFFTTASGRLPIVVDMGDCLVRPPWWLYLILTITFLTAIVGHLFFKRL